jgi:hypothetical protein
LAPSFLEEVKMAKTRHALVKMDDYATTYSTGGVVERIIVKDSVLDDEAIAEGRDGYEYCPGKEEPEYKLIPCGDDVAEGWIYTDKTNVFVNSNG